jgi:long-chain acyl-CoA synthetase
MRPGGESVAASGKSVDTLKLKSILPIRTYCGRNHFGENAMTGYYKNPEATAELIDEEGWLHTGDLGLIDRDGFIYIKGRCKSLILGSNGKNIYPEEIEATINNKFCIGESLVVHRDEKLIALIYPDNDAIATNHISSVCCAS